MDILNKIPQKFETYDSKLYLKCNNYVVIQNIDILQVLQNWKGWDFEHFPIGTIYLSVWDFWGTFHKNDLTTQKKAEEKWGGCETRIWVMWVVKNRASGRKI